MTTRASRSAAALLVGFLLTLGAAAPAGAQNAAFTISTKYPAVTVQPGDSASFPIDLAGTAGQRVDVSIDGVPEGWTATLRGGGSVVTAATIELDPAISELTLDVDVPAEAVDGETTLMVGGTSGIQRASLDLGLTVSLGAGGEVTLTTDSPALNATPDASVTFTLDLDNQTPQEQTYTLQASGPPGWIVEARPQAEAQAATLTVAARESAQVTVEVTPLPDAAAQEYPITVTASGGDADVTAELIVNITGSFEMSLTTPDQRLNAEVTAGGSGTVDLLVVNDGASPLQGVTVTATPPSGWEATFSPESIDVIQPGEAATVTATLTPTGETLAGDYVVAFRANNADSSANAEVSIRTTVNTSRLAGILGIVAIGVALLVLVLVFQRFGRR